MAPPEKPSRLGRGLDALLARREPSRPKAEPATEAPPSASVEATRQTASEQAPLASNEPGQVGGDASTQIERSSRGEGSNVSTPIERASTGEGTNAGKRIERTSTGEGTSAGVPIERAPTGKGTIAASATASGVAGPADENAADPVRAEVGVTQSERAKTGGARTEGYQLLPIAHIAPNRFQPRKEFREEELAELEASLRSQGLLQPITVRPAPEHSGYELIAGERRLRAATRLGWKEIPAIVRETNDRTMLTLAMVENLQRADLDPIDEADGYQRLIDDFDLTQQEVADVVGKERPTVANALRLLALPASVKRMLQDRHITTGHARALLPLETERAISDLARDIVAKSLSVRDVELRVRNTRPNPAKSGRKTKAQNAAQRAAQTAGSASSGAELRRIEELLRKKLQTTVTLHATGAEKGEVRIAFFSNDDLERVLQLLGVELDS